VARFLLVGGGCRGLGLARLLTAEGHAVRVTTRTEEGRSAVEAAGAECWIGDPDRIGTLRYALDSVTALCWLLGTATGPAEQVAALHDTRLEMMLARTIDTTVRGFVYESAGTVAPDALARGADVVREVASRSGIPAEVLSASPKEREAWTAAARDAISRVLGVF
jgi:uncharacterized protein YbjT (DUF2867 family)